MSSENYTCICLSQMDYKESDKLLTLYAKGKGKLTATLRGCKNIKSKLKYAASPMCFGDYEFNLTRGKYIVTGVSDVELFSNLWADLDKFYIGMSMLEIFNKFTYENEVYDEMFLELLKALKALNDVDSNAFAIFSFYLFKITESVGYAPYVDGCIKCGDTDLDNKRFSYQDGGIVCRECGNGVSLNSEVLQILQDLESSNMQEFITKNYSRSNLLNVIFIFSKYLEHILGEKVKSLCQFLDNML